MSSVNKAFILGRLGKDPEVRYSPDGKGVTTLSVATSTVGKNTQGDKTEYTEWHRLVAFNKAAEVAGKYLKKGDLVHIEGSLRTRKYDEHGVTKYSTEIVVGRLSLLGNKGSNEVPAFEVEVNNLNDYPF